MNGYKVNIEEETVDNTDYRRVIYTTNETQLVLMSIPKNDDIDKETHKTSTQFIRVEEGSGVAYINNKQYRIKAGDALVIPAGVLHYIKNTSKEPLKIYTLYSPPQHPKDLIERFH
jgi:mannose-6-phosphate isomerase-like protein (cupin superfamily)